MEDRIKKLAASLRKMRVAGTDQEAYEKAKRIIESQSNQGTPIGELAKLQEEATKDQLNEEELKEELKEVKADIDEELQELEEIKKDVEKIPEEIEKAEEMGDE